VEQRAQLHPQHEVKANGRFIEHEELGGAEHGGEVLHDLHPADRAHQGGLTAAARPDQVDDQAAEHAQAQAVQHRMLPPSGMQVAHDNGVSGCARHRCIIRRSVALVSIRRR